MPKPELGGTADATLVGAAEKIEGLFAGTTGNEQDREAPTPKKRPTPKQAEEREDEPEESDADESEEVETEAAESGEDAEEEDTADESESTEDDEEQEGESKAKPKTRRLTVKSEDGKDEEVEVTDQELESGYLRQRDYTRKTMAHAETVKKFKAEREAVVAERQQYKDLLGKLEEAVVQLSPDTEPDWATLQTELDTEQFNTVFAQYQANRQKLARVRAEKARVEQKLAEDAREQLKEKLARESELLLEALPAWKKPEVAARERVKLIQFAKTLGFDDNDIAQVADHRVLVLLNDAMRYRSLEQKRKAAKETIRKTADNVKPGAATADAPNKAKHDAARKRLKKSGAVHDAASLIFDMLPD